MHRYWIILAAVIILSGTCSVWAQKTRITGNGKVDESAAIQKALDECSSKGGGTVNLPSGKFRLDKPVTIPSGVTLAGSWQGPHHAQLDKGSVILVYASRDRENDPPLISMKPNSTVQGFTIYYPEQRPEKIVPYPWTIQGEGMHCNILDLTLVNPYKAIDFGTRANELHHIRNVYGCPLKTGVFIDKCTDIGRIENVHFNPHYWVRAEPDKGQNWANMGQFLKENCIAFEIGRADWEAMVNTFSFGCKIGYRFFKSKDGACNGSFMGIAADYTPTAILVEETQKPGLLITNGEFVGQLGTEALVEVAGSHTGVVHLNNCGFWGPQDRIARISGNGMVSFNGCNIVEWNQAHGKPAFELKGGSVSIQGCSLGPCRDHALIEEGVKSVIISGNTSDVPLQVDNRSSGKVLITNNISVNDAQ